MQERTKSIWTQENLFFDTAQASAGNNGRTALQRRSAAMTQQTQNQLDQGFEQLAEMLITVVIAIASINGPLSLYAMPLLGVT